jgi:hypothetical protein
MMREEGAHDAHQELSRPDRTFGLRTVQAHVVGSNGVSRRDVSFGCQGRFRNRGMLLSALS